MRDSAIGHLQSLFEAGTVAGVSDGVLLERFVARRDGLAFEAIVARHGPLVLSVCRRMLPEPSDVEDAFQATFLILVRKVGTLRDRQRLGPWLYGVAHRVAIRARVQAAHRRSHERRGAGEASAESSGDLERRELFLVLDDEVSRLPEKYRAVVVLCDLEGRTHEEAARELDYPLGTVKTRLDWARKRLRSRLTSRGLAPSAVTLATGLGLTTRSARAAVPARLLVLTVGAAMRGVAGRATLTGAVSESVSILTEGVLMTMFLSKLKMISAIVLALGLCTAGLAVLAQPPGDNKQDKPATQPADAQAKSSTHDDFPFVIAFERGDTKFAPGDQIAITEVRGTSSDMESGICRISGTYTLASQDDATLAASVTASKQADAKGPWNRAQTMTITKGQGNFTLMLPISIKGWPHVSFYGKSSSLGGTYIGTGDWIQRSH